MNGFEALKLMQEGKKVCLASKPEIKYGLANGFIGIVDDRGCFVEDTLFNFRLDYEECIEPKPSTGWERVNEGEKYYSIGGSSICRGKETYHLYDDRKYEWSNYFSTQEKAEEIIFKQTLFRKLQRFSDENGGNEIDWSDVRQPKWFISHDHIYEELKVFNNIYAQSLGQVYFISEEVAEQAIELFHDELIKYFTHDWSGENE